MSLVIGFNVVGTTNRKWSEVLQVDGLVVQAANRAGAIND
jgi:hypothetical protein